MASLSCGNGELSPLKKSVRDRDSVKSLRDRDSVISSLSVPSIHELCAQNRRSASLNETSANMNNNKNFNNNNNNNNNNNSNSYNNNDNDENNNHHSSSNNSNNNNNNNNSNNGSIKNNKSNIVLPATVKERGTRSRGALSADNSPVLSRKMKSREEDRSLSKGSLHTKLLIPNMEKFEIFIACPNESRPGQPEDAFQGQVFKVWTAAQLTWKIAHVRGMIEKIALIVREHITQLHLFRSLEDHECVYEVMQNWAPDSNNALKMIEDASKYELFHKPDGYLPLELLDVKYASMLKDLDNDASKQPQQQQQLQPQPPQQKQKLSLQPQQVYQQGSESPPTSRPRAATQTMRHNIYSFMVKADTGVDLHHWVLIKDFDKKSWTPKYLRIKESVLYLCDDETQESQDWELLYYCSDVYLYECLDEFHSVHKPPYKHCFCIIPSVVNKWKQIKCFSIKTPELLRGWITGFRLAKYGQQLFRNFCEAMSKEENLCRANSAHQRSMFFHQRRHSENGILTDDKATLDFSGDNARIISDPLERLQIHNQLGFEIPRPPKRRSETFSPMTFRRAILSQKPWYHGKVKREEAVSKLRKNGMKEGMFLVRESPSCHGNLVLSVVRKGKIAHHQIFQETSEGTGRILYGMQHGPQFTSLEHLVEAYTAGTVDVDFLLKKPCPTT